jgi:hypothetical protein
VHKLGIAADLPNTAIDHVLFVPQSGNRLAQFIPEFITVVTTHVLEFNLFEILPDALDWVQIGRVARQALNVDVTGGTLRQESFDLTIVDRGTVPHNQQLRADLPLELLEKADHIGTGECPILPTHVQLASRADRTDHRTMIATQRLVQDGCLTNRRICPYGSRQQVKAGFVQED